MRAVHLKGEASVGFLNFQFLKRKQSLLFPCTRDGICPYRRFCFHIPANPFKKNVFSTKRLTIELEKMSKREFLENSFIFNERDFRRRLHTLKCVNLLRKFNFFFTKLSYKLIKGESYEPFFFLFPQPHTLL